MLEGDVSALHRTIRALDHVPRYITVARPNPNPSLEPERVRIQNVACCLMSAAVPRTIVTRGVHQKESLREVCDRSIDGNVP